MSSWPVNKLRERAMTSLMEHVHYEDENTNYICVDAVSKVIASVEIEAPLRNCLNKMQKGRLCILIFCALVLVLVFLLLYDILHFQL